MYIYLTKTEKGFFPVMATKVVDGAQELKPVAGYYIHRLQEFVRKNPSLPQDGYYEPITREEYEEYCDALEEALMDCPRISEVDEVMPLHFELDEDGKKVVMTCEDCDDDWDCWDDDDEDEDEDEDECDEDEEVEEPVDDVAEAIKEELEMCEARKAELLEALRKREEECNDAEEDEPAAIMHVVLRRRIG